MIRWVLWLFAGIFLGGIVHLGSILALPRTATHDAYARLSPLTPVNAFATLPEAAPGSSAMPFMDPAFAVAVCRFDLATAPIKLTVPVSPAYTSVTFYTRQGVAFYAINDRAAGRRSIELDLMTPAQRSLLPDEEDVTSADRLIIEAPTQTGMIVTRALSPEPGQMERTRASLATARCESQPQ
jgi:uncharacterized membrane protein